jgi:hypothetical protein
MHPDLRGRRRTSFRTALVLTGTLTAALLTVPPAQAQVDRDCREGQKTLDCIQSREGGTSDGGGGGPTAPAPIPTDEFGGFFGLAGPADPTTEQLAQTVRDTAPFPPVKVHTAPATRTYVKVRTGLWVDGFQTVQTEPITLDGQTIQATATPRSVTWNLGETTITCTGPGRPNDTSCGHTYQRSSLRQPGGAYRISATITWDVAWTCTGAPCQAPGGTLEPMIIPSEAVPLVVDEIQTSTRP